MQVIKFKEMMSKVEYEFSWCVNKISQKVLNKMYGDQLGEIV